MSPWLKVALVAVVVLCVLAAVKQIRFRRLGYRIGKVAREQFAYEERVGGDVRRVVFDGEMLVGEKNVIYVPDEETWAREAPEWARGRRKEIVGRLRAHLGEERYTYES